MKMLANVFALFTCLSCAAPSQVPAASFDVASVRVAATNQDPEPIQVTPGTLTIRHQSLEACIQWAYDVPGVQISGPVWLSDIRLDIAAKAAGPADEMELRMMLRTLLVDRMGLKVHTDSKEMPVYVLMLTDGGPKFRESATEGPPPLWRRSEGVLSAVRVSMKDLAEQISGPLNRPVIDATGLRGRYDIRIDISAYMLAANADRAAGEMDPMSILFTAMPQQLGLRLDSRRAAVDILVIDHVDKVPTGN